MRVKDMLNMKEFKVVNKGNAPDREVTKPFCCDLLSIAMGKSPEGAAWVTVMANMNTLAVTTLTDAACLILAEGAAFDEMALNKACTEGISVFSTELPIFEAALLIHERLIVTA